MTPSGTVEVRPASRFLCGEVRGGNDTVYERVDLPGLRGVLYSSPCRGTNGGDIHYLSVCGSGLLARVCLADVAGHGEAIAAVGTAMHQHLQRSVDTVDERRVLARLDRRLDRANLEVMITAALVTYYPPSGRLTVSYAGHPPGWLYRAQARRWIRLDDPPALPARGRLVDLPLGTGLAPTFTRRRFDVSPGDRLLVITDGVIEAPSPQGDLFGEARLDALLRDEGGDARSLDARLLDALRAHVDGPHLPHDDVTFFFAEIVPGPPGPALWHVFKNRVLHRGRRAAAPRGPSGHV